LREDITGGWAKHHGWQKTEKYHHRKRTHRAGLHKTGSGNNEYHGEQASSPTLIDVGEKKKSRMTREDRTKGRRKCSR